MKERKKKERSQKHKNETNQGNIFLIHQKEY